MFLKTALSLVLISFTLTSYASVYNAAKIYSKTRGNPKHYHRIAKELVDEGIYYAAIPFIKDYLVYLAESGKRKNLDDVIDKVITNVGTKQFEILPLSILKASNSPMIRYIRAKKLFRGGKYKQALAEVAKKIPVGHSMKPYSLLLEASILSIIGQYPEAIQVYRECIDSSESMMSRTKNKNKLKQIEINRDYCVIGIPRTQYANKQFEKANLSYLDLPKDSYIWPEILFEEAWNSFYTKDYNRTLGKLVTYKAPVLNHVFNPENNVLTALAYMNLCLWGDANTEVDGFYTTYRDDALALKKFLERHGKDFKYYYKIARQKETGPLKGTRLINQLMDSIVFNPTYSEILDSFITGKNEVTYLSRLKLGRFKKVVLRNVKDSLILQRDLIGRYVRKTLILRYGQLFRAFEGMSYIKLEVLSRKKKQLYDNFGKDAEKKGRSRGDISYLARNDKQYFWTFNGEFWADELGDYVFALKSECSQ